MPYREARRADDTCPRCAEPLLPVAALPTTKWCEKCGGVFADLEASKRILLKLDRTLLEIGFQTALGRAKKNYDARPITCPECQIEMVRSRIESANCDVDACPLHGTWFDTGELEHVMRAFNKARRSGIILDRSSEPVGPDIQVEPPQTRNPEAADVLGISGFLAWLDRNVF